MPIFIFYFLAAIQIFFAYKSLQGGIDYQTYFKSELAKPTSNFMPFASVIVPCRGLDIDLAENLEALFEQDYPEFEVIFAVDDKNDDAVELIESISRKSVKLIVAGNAENCGQKVHNLRKAVVEVSDKSKVFVFVDSDARPDKNWLKNLIAPLEDKKIGCATGYRWFVQKKGGFATHLRSVWNASIASALGQNMENNFCWGGSTAIRREVFEQLNVREKWLGTLSDDFALTNILRKVGMPIYFVPSCLTATVEDCTFSELLEFTTRQMKITRVYSPNHLTISLIGSLLFTFTFWTGIVLLVFISGIHFYLTLLISALIFAFGVGKAWIRLNAVKLVLTDYKDELNKQFFPQILLWTLSPILFLYNDIIAMFSRKIIWRGIEYKMESAKKTFVGKTNG